MPQGKPTNWQCWSNCAASVGGNGEPAPAILSLLSPIQVDKS